MQIAQGIAHLQHPLLHVFLGLRTLAAHHVGQGRTLDVVHDDVDEVLGLLDIDDVDDIGVVELGEKLGLAGQRLLNRTAGGVGCVAVDLFDGPLFVGELQVGGQVDAAHAALADHRQNLIAALDDVAHALTARVDLSPASGRRHGLSTSLSLNA